MSVTLAEPQNESIVPGNQVLLVCQFKVEGVLADPPRVELRIKDPNDATTTPAPTRISVGVYHYEYEPEVEGRYDFWWDGDEVAATQGSFVIGPKAA